eukprot:snap_masked-scaffold_8-processed-gene-5.48-mRNA-1 protein AED:0.32 eAED:1.00 QI:0/0/0/1/1/1/2/0/395
MNTEERKELLPAYRYIDDNVTKLHTFKALKGLLDLLIDREISFKGWKRIFAVTSADNILNVLLLYTLTSEYFVQYESVPRIGSLLGTYRKVGDLSLGRVETQIPGTLRRSNSVLFSGENAGVKEAVKRDDKYLFGLLLQNAYVRESFQWFDVYQNLTSGQIYSQLLRGDVNRLLGKNEVKVKQQEQVFAMFALINEYKDTSFGGRFRRKEDSSIRQLKVHLKQKGKILYEPVLGKPDVVSDYSSRELTTESVIDFSDDDDGLSVLFQREQVAEMEVDEIYNSGLELCAKILQENETELIIRDAPSDVGLGNDVHVLQVEDKEVKIYCMRCSVYTSLLNKELGVDIAIPARTNYRWGGYRNDLYRNLEGINHSYKSDSTLNLANIHGVVWKVQQKN